MRYWIEPIYLDISVVSFLWDVMDILDDLLTDDNLKLYFKTTTFVTIEIDLVKFVTKVKIVDS